MPNLLEQALQAVADQNESAAGLLRIELQTHKKTKSYKKAINCYLRLELAELPMDTTRARGCLIDQKPTQVWLSDFKAEVAPVVANDWYKNKNGKHE